MKVSILTPTADRGPFLRGLYTLLQKQTYPDWEWLIYDTSLYPENFADPRICYTHSDEILTIGEKRRRLVSQASGAYIVQCDDDDYYAPNYLAFMVEQLKKTAFCALDAWFCYDVKTGQIYYRSAYEQLQTHYQINALSGTRIREIDKQIPITSTNRGYGFSFAYQKEVAARCFFPDTDRGEDRDFYKAVCQAWFSVEMRGDQKGIAVHVIHEMNTSSDYPQYRIPRFLVEKQFTPFFNYIAQFDEN